MKTTFFNALWRLWAGEGPHSRHAETDPGGHTLIQRGRHYERRVYHSLDALDVPCRACGAASGALHEYGCYAEACPLCGGQLITCGCFEERLAGWAKPDCVH